MSDGWFNDKYRDSKCYDGHAIGDDGKCVNCGKQLR